MGKFAFSVPVIAFPSEKAPPLQKNMTLHFTVLIAVIFAKTLWSSEGFSVTITRCGHIVGDSNFCRKVNFRSGSKSEYRTSGALPARVGDHPYADLEPRTAYLEPGTWNRVPRTSNLEPRTPFENDYPSDFARDCSLKSSGPADFPL